MRVLSGHHRPPVSHTFVAPEKANHRQQHSAAGHETTLRRPSLNRAALSRRSKSTRLSKHDQTEYLVSRGLRWDQLQRAFSPTVDEAAALREEMADWYFCEERAPCRTAPSNMPMGRQMRPAMSGPSPYAVDLRRKGIARSNMQKPSSSLVSRKLSRGPTTHSTPELQLQRRHRSPHERIVSTQEPSRSLHELFPPASHVDAPVRTAERNNILPAWATKTATSHEPHNQNSDSTPAAQTDVQQPQAPNCEFQRHAKEEPMGRQLRRALSGPSPYAGDSRRGGIADVLSWRPSSALVSRKLSRGPTRPSTPELQSLRTPSSFQERVVPTQEPSRLMHKVFPPASQVDAPVTHAERHSTLPAWATKKATNQELYNQNPDCTPAAQTDVQQKSSDLNSAQAIESFLAQANQRVAAVLSNGQEVEAGVCGSSTPISAAAGNCTAGVAVDDVAKQSGTPSALEAHIVPQPPNPVRTDSGETSTKSPSGASKEKCTTTQATGEAAQLTASSNQSCEQEGSAAASKHGSSVGRTDDENVKDAEKLRITSSRKDRRVESTNFENASNYEERCLSGTHVDRTKDESTSSNHTLCSPTSGSIQNTFDAVSRSLIEENNGNVPSFSSNQHTRTAGKTASNEERPPLSGRSRYGSEHENSSGEEMLSPSGYSMGKPEDKDTKDDEQTSPSCKRRTETKDDCGSDDATLSPHDNNRGGTENKDASDDEFEESGDEMLSPTSNTVHKTEDKRASDPQTDSPHLNDKCVADDEAARVDELFLPNGNSIEVDGRPVTGDEIASGDERPPQADKSIGMAQDDNEKGEATVKTSFEMRERAASDNEKAEESYSDGFSNRIDIPQNGNEKGHATVKTSFETGEGAASDDEKARESYMDAVSDSIGITQDDNEKGEAIVKTSFATAEGAANDDDNEKGRATVKTSSAMGEGAASDDEKAKGSYSETFSNNFGLIQDDNEMDQATVKTSFETGEGAANDDEKAEESYRDAFSNSIGMTHDDSGRGHAAVITSFEIGEGAANDDDNDKGQATVKESFETREGDANDDEKAEESYRDAFSNSIGMTQDDSGRGHATVKTSFEIGEGAANDDDNEKGQATVKTSFEASEGDAYDDEKAEESYSDSFSNSIGITQDDKEKREGTVKTSFATGGAASDDDKAEESYSETFSNSFGQIEDDNERGQATAKTSFEMGGGAANDNEKARESYRDAFSNGIGMTQDDSGKGHATVKTSFGMREGTATDDDNEKGEATVKTSFETREGDAYDDEKAEESYSDSFGNSIGITQEDKEKREGTVKTSFETGEAPASGDEKSEESYSDACSDRPSNAASSSAKSGSRSMSSAGAPAIQASEPHNLGDANISVKSKSENLDATSNSYDEEGFEDQEDAYDDDDVDDTDEEFNESNEN